MLLKHFDNMNRSISQCTSCCGCELPDGHIIRLYSNIPSIFVKHIIILPEVKHDIIDYGNITGLNSDLIDSILGHGIPSQVLHFTYAFKGAGNVDRDLCVRYLKSEIDILKPESISGYDSRIDNLSDGGFLFGYKYYKSDKIDLFIKYLQLLYVPF